MTSKTLKCPECGYTYEPIGDEVVYCTGKRTPNSVAHKKPMRMR